MALKMTEQQNKLHDAELTSVLFDRHARSIALKFVAGWIRWVTGFSDSPSFLTEDQLTTLKEQILQHERCLIVIEPSCGAELAAIARSYSVSTD